VVSLALERRRPRWVLVGGRWAMTGSLILLAAATSTALIGMITGGAWWAAFMGTATLVLVSAAGLRTIGVSRFIVPLICAAELLVVLTAAFGAGRSLAAVIPTPAVFQRFAELFAQAGISIDQQAVPAESLPEFLFLITLFSGAAALAFDVLANTLRVPALTALVVGAVLVVPSLLLPSGTSPLSLLACVAAYLLVLRTDARARTGWGELGLSLSIAASVMVIALAISTTAPGFQQIGRQGVSSSGISIGGGVNPLIDLGQDLRRPAAVPVFQYTSTAKTQPYLRLTALDQFTGTIWRHRGGTIAGIPPDGTIGPVPGLSAAVARAKITTDIQITNMRSAWIPAPYPVTGVRGLDGHWLWNAADLTVSAVDRSTQGQTYRVSGLDLEPTAEQLADAGDSIPPAVARDLFVPFDAPPVITETALEVTRGATNAYDQSLALQNYFQNGGFSYSTTAPVHDSYDGDSMQSIAAFLRLKSGYCVHFASAMAVMARTLGIPARIGMGYLPGTVIGAQGDQTLFGVTSDDLHAWPELYFAGIGWVPFEPTVSRGSLPAYTLPGGLSGTQAGQPASTPTASGAALAPETSTTGGSTGNSARAEELGAIVSGTLIAVFVLLLLLTPAAIRRWQRISRLRLLRDDWGSPRLAWRELQQTARDLGMAVPDTQTPREFAARIAAMLQDDRQACDALAVLRDATEREQYGRPGHGSIDPDRAQGLRVTVAALLRAVPVPVRVRAFLVPVSLLPRAAPLLRGRARLTA
jgi:transglutaminase-like putative cysteine protease